MDWSSLMPWRKRNRKRATVADAPAAEPLDLRRFAVTCAALAGVALVASLVHVALDRPVRRVLVEGAFQRVSPPEI